MFGTRWGENMGPDSPFIQLGARNSGMAPPGQEHGRRSSRRPSMAAMPPQQHGPSMSATPRQLRRSSMSFGPQQQNGLQPPRSSSFGARVPHEGPVFGAPSRHRGHAMGPEPQFVGPVMPSPGFFIREARPQRRSSMAEPGIRVPGKSARFQTTSPPTVRAQGRFPFTVFGKGTQNQPDRTSRRSSMFGLENRGGAAGGQHVGNHIMRKYVIKQALKKGGMAEAVNIIQSKSSGSVYVQKCIPLRNRRDHKRARAEINMLLKIAAHRGNDNLNAIVESEISEARRQCFIILEFCDLGTVEDTISSFRKRGIRGAESSAWNLMAGVANGLAFLHHGLVNGRQVEANWDPICHLDLKPCNIFNSSKGAKNGHCRIVLADFGCAIAESDVERQIESPFMPECGTPGWYPPEGRMEGHHTVPYYGPKTDMWQLGATLHVFCKVLERPDRRYLSLPRPCSGYYSGWLNRLVKQLCHPTSDYRPGAPGIASEASFGFEQALHAQSSY